MITLKEASDLKKQSYGDIIKWRVYIETTIRTACKASRLSIRVHGVPDIFYPTLKAELLAEGFRIPYSSTNKLGFVSFTVEGW